MPRGGARPNSGPKRGQKFKSTITKEEAREALRTIVIQRMERLVAAQLDNAEGIRHLMLRDPATGKFERVSGDEIQIDIALQSNNAVWIYTKDPSIQAFTDLMNRALDKPAEQAEQKEQARVEVTIKVQQLAQVMTDQELNEFEQRVARAGIASGNKGGHPVPANA